MRKAPLFLTLILTLAFASAVEAKNRDKSWEFGALVNHIDGDFNAKSSNGIAGELRFGYNFSSKLMAELWLSDEQTEQGNTPDFQLLGLRSIREDPCPNVFDANTPTCTTAIFPTTADFNKSVELRRAIVTVTGNFLTDRDGNTIPYISAGLGFIQETREPSTFETPYRVSEDDDNNPSTPRVISDRNAKGDVLESFDSSAILALSIGARTFFNDNWGVRYEVGYAHHNSFDKNQDEYTMRVGMTWIVGGQK
ncbi:MAG TPA: outer membrane beta-barrel protein [Candidatus Polarisedimenticolia bacterium]|jgi:outer membrane protein W